MLSPPLTSIYHRTTKHHFLEKQTKWLDELTRSRGQQQREEPQVTASRDKVKEGLEGAKMPHSPFFQVLPHKSRFLYLWSSVVCYLPTEDRWASIEYARVLGLFQHTHAYCFQNWQLNMSNGFPKHLIIILKNESEIDTRFFCRETPGRLLRGKEGTRALTEAQRSQRGPLTSSGCNSQIESHLRN